MTSFDDETDPGPHTCVYVLVDDHDECTICGRDSDPFRDLGDEWDIDWDGAMFMDDGPEYDYEGGGGV